MDHRRSRVQIIRDVLEVCKTGSKKTWIVYRTNINFVLLKSYKNFLVGEELLVQKGDMFYTTERGFQAIQSIESLEKFSLLRGEPKLYEKDSFFQR